MELRVFERRPRWGPELQRQFLRDETVKVTSCGLIRDLRDSQSSGSVVLLLDLRDAEPDVLQFLGELQQHPTGASVVVITGTDGSELEWTLRELGASDVVVGESDGASLARLCRRQLRYGRQNPSAGTASGENSRDPVWTGTDR